MENGSKLPVSVLVCQHRFHLLKHFQWFFAKNGRDFFWSRISLLNYDFIEKIIVRSCVLSIPRFYKRVRSFCLLTHPLHLPFDLGYDPSVQYVTIFGNIPDLGHPNNLPPYHLLVILIIILTNLKQNTTNWQQPQDRQPPGHCKSLCLANLNSKFQ